MTGSDAAKLLDAAEHGFDPTAVLPAPLVISERALAVAPTEDPRDRSLIAENGSGRIRIVAAIGNRPRSVVSTIGGSAPFTSGVGPGVRTTRSGRRVDRRDQVRRSDITFLPMRRSFLYLVAIMDWFTRKGLGPGVSNTVEADFCVQALREALHGFGAPDIMNADQGSRFMSFARTDRLRRFGMRISKDGKGRCLDSVFIERPCGR